MKASVILGIVLTLVYIAHSTRVVEAAKKKPKGPKVTEQVNKGLRA